MSVFDRFADRVAEAWSSAPWFCVCAAFILGWLLSGFWAGWNNDRWHLWLNSPTTGLTFLGVFLLHNTQHRFERATNERLHAIAHALGLDDPADDDGQKPDEVTA